MGRVGAGVVERKRGGGDEVKGMKEVKEVKTRRSCYNFDVRISAAER